MKKPSCLEIVPSKIIAIGLNYRGHAQELGLEVPKTPIIFLKAPSSLIDNHDTILLPPESSRVEYEAELALVIGKTASRVSQADALDYVAGYTCLNDVTARDLQRSEKQWARAKSFDTFCPVGPVVVPGLDPTKLEIMLRLNGKLMQDSHTSDFIFPPDYIVSYVSHCMTLFPGDLITTGSPPGTASIKAGDLLEVEINGIGVLSNKVATLETA